MDPEIPAAVAASSPEPVAPKQPDPNIEEFRKLGGMLAFEVDQLNSKLSQMRYELTALKDAVRTDLAKLIRKPSEF